MRLIDSTLLIELLTGMSSEITIQTLPLLLLTDRQKVYRLAKWEAFWPRHNAWRKDALELFDDEGHDEEVYKKAGIVHLLNCCPMAKEEIESLHKRFYRLFEEIFNDRYYFNCNTTKYAEHIINFLRKVKVDPCEIDHISSFNSFEEITDYLITRAEKKGSPDNKKIKTKKSKKTPITPINHSPETQTSLSASEIKLCSYFDLKEQGLSALDISKQLIDNDAKLYGSENLGRHAGDPQLWCDHILAFPKNWHFLCKGTEIIGNWSFTFLSSEQEIAIRAGNFYGDQFAVDQTPYPSSNSTKDAVIHLLNFSINDGYQTGNNWKLLWKAFGKRLQEFTEQGIFYKGIYAYLFRKDHQGIFSDMGFQHLGSAVGDAEIFYLDLTTKIPESFSSIMPNDSLEELYENHWGKPIEYRQLSSSDILSNQQLSDISALIYDTDDYIYPAMMTREQAKKILPLVLTSKQDNMFSLDNIFAAIAGERIIGVILHKRGSLNWNSTYLRMYAGFLGEELPETLDKVEKEYFSEYDKPGDHTSIINVCVHSNWRMRDIRVGTHMMEMFAAKHPEQLELYVLQETLAAFRVYSRNGFVIDHLCNGFSVDDRDLPCAFMVRYPIK